ncbi:MAG: substrate-binding domain-containing protein [Mariprofundaceae bacterium]
MRPRTLHRLLALALMLAPSAASAGPPVATTVAPEVIISGSTTMQPLLQRATALLHARRPAFAFRIEPTGSDAGLARLLNGRAHIAAMSRAPDDAERRRIEKRGIRIVPVAKDAVLPVVSHEIHAAGVHTLSREDLARIWRGEARNWRAFGGPDKPILVVHEERRHATGQLMLRWLFGDDTAARLSPQTLFIDSIRQMKRALRASDQAIGYLPAHLVDQDTPAPGLRQADGSVLTPPATPADARNWPLIRPLVLLIAPNASEAARALTDLLLSPEGQKLVREAGFLPEGGAKPAR